MKLKAVTRILSDRLLGQPPRETYWNTAQLFKSLGLLFRQQNRRFGGTVARNFREYLSGGPRPVCGETVERAAAAVDWLLLAQRETPDDGVSLGYFPCNGKNNGWLPSYPETTGYIITSLLNFAAAFDRPDVRDAALRMADWEASVQMPSGAVQGGTLRPPERQTPATFNTGMVLDGWCSSLEMADHDNVAAASRRAADFLVQDQREDGYFRTNGEFVAAGSIKNYNCLCGWALYRYGNLVDEDEYRHSAVRAVEAALRLQRPNGWFAENCLTEPDSPLLHTLGYTLQGILEVGLLAGREDFLAAFKSGADPLQNRMHPIGYLAGRYYSDWEPAVFSSCLTGSAQLAVVCYRYFEHTRDESYRAAADRIVDHLKALQVIDAPAEPFNGALAGSFPIFGSYMRGGYPNWATKYFLDALMLQHRTRPAADTR